MEQPPPAQQQHFLIACFHYPGHVNPARALARRIAGAGARVTISTALSGHRRIFPSVDAGAGDDTPSVDNHGIFYIPHSDGYDSGFDFATVDFFDYARKFYAVGEETLSGVVAGEAVRGRPVTAIIYTLTLSFAATVAKKHNIPCAMFWIQPAAALAAYYHYFHGYSGEIDAHAGEPEHVIAMPHLRLKIRDLPSFIVRHEDPVDAISIDSFKRSVEAADEHCVRIGGKPAVLVNTAGDLEPDAIASVEEHWNVVPVGPMIEESAGGIYKEDEEKKYMAWLDAQPAMSVVYISFGSIAAYKPRQLEEMKKGLAAGGRPFLWVIRTNNGGWSGDVGAGGGMVLSWCDQVEVLRHGAVGCFVTHCGWNSTLEAVAAGVPVVAVPQWTDQETNAKLAVEEWKCGVRGKVDGEGVLCAEELRRCVDEVMAGDGEVRRRVAEMKETVRGAVASSERRLHGFLAELAAA